MSPLGVNTLQISKTHKVSQQLISHYQVQLGANTSRRAEASFRWRESSFNARVQTCDFQKVSMEYLASDVRQGILELLHI